MNINKDTAQSFLLAFLLTLQQAAQANPSGEQVIQGQASFSRSGKTLTIKQSSQRAIINWQSFSIDKGELTQFKQPNSNAAVLNRVVSGNPTEIFGTLKANGQVFLINPNGIVVGKDGVINTQSFIASTLDVSNAEFMSGSDLHFSGNSEEMIINLGKIDAAGGDVYLIAQKIDNQGVLSAKEGQIGLAAGTDVLLSVDSEEKLNVRLTATNASINNSGLITAARAELKAVGNNPYALAINHDGVIRASGAKTENGRVILSATRGVNKVSGEIIAEHNDNKAGRVHLFSNDTTEFTGKISAEKQAEVHISGVEKLVFDGQVDTENGNLILDPNNVEITNGAATLAGASTISVAAVTGALATNNVVIHTSGTDGEDGDIRVSRAVNYSSSNNLTLLAHRHVEINRSVQNDGNGDVNAVAGWDGTTGFSATPNTAQETGDADISAIYANTSSFGNAGGDVKIGDGTQTVGIAFGSRSGETNIAANNITLQSGTTTRDYTQVGRRINSSIANFDSTGDIKLVAKNDITLNSGNATDAYTQIGHGGRDFGGAAIDGDQSGAIDITAGNDLSLNGGSGRRAYSQLGHGGDDIDGSHSGSVDIDVSGDMQFTAGARDAYVQLGHGGRASSGDHSGAININNTSELNFSAGAREAYAQLGHGGRVAKGNHSGDITIANASNTTLNAGNTQRAYAQLGHGGYDADGQHSGDIDLTMTGDLAVMGGTSSDTYAQLGHGGRSARGEFTGDITINQVNDINFAAGNTVRSSVQLGHGGYDADATLGTGKHSGDIEITNANNVTFSAGAANQSSARLGHGGYRTNGDHSGDIIITDVKTIDFNAAAGDDAYAQLGHGGTQSKGAMNGNISIAKADSITFDSANDRRAYSQLGHGGHDADGDHIGNINIDLAKDILFTAGNADDAYAQLGHGGRSADVATTSSITISKADDITFMSGNNRRAYSQLGHGGWGSRRDRTASITISEANNISAIGGNGQQAYSQIGLGGYNADGIQQGDINIGIVNDINVTAGNGRDAYAQLGLGGRGNNRSHSGDITITQSSDIQIRGGAGRDAYAQIGTGGRSAVGNQTGNLTITNAEALTIEAGSGRDASAKLGAGGRSATGNHDGDINLNLSDDLDIKAGTGRDSFAQLGNGSFGSVGNHSGDIAISTSKDIAVTGGSHLETYAQIGHGGRSASGNHSGDITVTNANNIALMGGSSTRSSVQIGHGGFNADGNLSGNIDITATGTTMVVAGSANQANAKIGLGGRSADGAMSGSIQLNSNDLDLQGATGGNDRYAQIGHGSAGTATGIAIGSGTRQGDITVNVTDETSLENGTGSRSIWRIGHNSNVLANITNANISLTTGTLDQTKGAGASIATLDQDFANKFEHNLRAGNVNIDITGTKLLNDGDWIYNSANTLSLTSAQDMDINRSIVNSGAGEINLNFGQALAGTLDLDDHVISNAAVNISGGAGDDSFNILDGFDTNFPGTYNFNGGAGAETLRFTDNADPDGDTYNLTPDSIVKNATTINYRNFETLELQTGAGADLVIFTGFPSFTVNLDGGNPGTFPGDVLIAPETVNHINFETVTLIPVPDNNAFDSSFADNFLAQQENDIRDPLSASNGVASLFLRGLNSEFPFRVAEDEEAINWLSLRSSYDDAVDGMIKIN